MTVDHWIAVFICTTLFLITSMAFIEPKISLYFCNHNWIFLKECEHRITETLVYKGNDKFITTNGYKRVYECSKCKKCKTQIL